MEGALVLACPPGGHANVPRTAGTGQGLHIYFVLAHVSRRAATADEWRLGGSERPDLGANNLAYESIRQ